MNRRHASLLLFLIGLGSVTQFHFIGSLGLSEFPMFLLAPFVFLIDYKKLKADGFMPFVWLSILTCIGCVVSSRVNHTPNVFFIKGLAQPYAIFASTVVLHNLLRNNFGGLKFFLIGALCSSVISIFAFQQETFTAGAEGVVAGAAAVERVTGYVLFWSHMISDFLTLPVKAAYFSTPTLYSGGIGIVLIVITLLISHGSGRATSLVLLSTAVLIFIGRKSRRRMARMGNKIMMLAFCFVVALLLFKVVYSWAAKNGHLGYEAQKKYLRQTRQGESALSILMSGRMEFFCGLMACLDHPILGFGPKGEDTEGYTERYLKEFGAQEDYETYIKTIQWLKSSGQYFYLPIPAHSYIAMFWIGYGIIGLILWLYVLWLFFMYLRKYASAIPQWYGFICIGLTGETWSIFFNPFANRVSLPLLVCCILFCKAVRTRKLSLPIEMEDEARRYD